MKKNLMYGLMLSAGLLSLASCSDDFTPGGSTMGKINPIVNLDSAPIKGGSRTSRSESQSISVNDLKLKLTPADPAASPRTWDSVSDFDNNEEFKVGDYTLEAYYGNADDEGFDKPYYLGSSTFTVAENKVSTVSLPVTLANSMVSVNTTEAFTGYFTAASFRINTTGSVNTINYAADENRPAYLKPGEVTIYADVTRPDGKQTSLQAAQFTAEARHHYTVTVDVNNGSVGSASMVISFDDSLDQETIEIDLSDELFATAAPTITVSGYDNNATYEYIQGNAPAALDPQISITAPGEIAKITMTVQSDWLLANGLSEQVQLNGNSASVYANYQALGITGKYNNVSKLAIINFAGLFASLRYVDGGNNVNSIAIMVTDKQGRTSEPVVFTATVDRLEASVADAPVMYDGDDTMELSVEYNGTDFANDVKFQYKNERDTWSDAAYDILSRASRSGDIYVVALKGLPTEGSVVIRMLLEGTQQYTKIVERADLSAQVNANDVFAHTAVVKVTSNSLDCNSASFEVSTNGVTFSPASAERIGEGTFRVSGLAANQSYKVRAIVDQARAAAAFATEAELQIPNGDMEAWCNDGSESNWTNYYAGASVDGAVWGTNNPMTTSQGVNVSYARATTTKPTSDAHSGSNAAWIRTMGWGSGNSASGSVSTGVMKYADPGLLHLGSSRSSRPDGYGDRQGVLTTDDLNCGLAFTSRPSSLSFWYKYSPKNGSDKGQVQFILTDVDGAALASTVLDLAAASQYTQVTIPVTYASGAKKAGRIYVKFISSNSRDYLTKDKSNFSAPSFGNLSNGEYLGSQLFIDDITLNY